jgi:hypothetical protein
MNDTEKTEAKIAAMELLMIHGYISLSKYLEFLRAVKK